MSIFKKIKQGLGIGTAKVKLKTRASVRKEAKEISGQVVISAKSDQKVKSIKISLVEKTKEAAEEISEPDTETTKQIDKIRLEESFEIKKGEEKTVDFTLPLLWYRPEDEPDTAFSVFDSEPEISKWFEVVATVDLESVAIDPTASNTIEFR